MSSKYSPFDYLKENADPPEPKKTTKTMALGDLIRQLQTLQQKLGEDTPVWIADGTALLPLEVVERMKNNEIVLAEFKV